MSESTGADADPSPGVVALYATDEEDGCAERHIVLSPRKSITFRSPWNIDPADGVSLTAFFLDSWPGHPKRGSYTLTITEADKRADTKQAENAARQAQTLIDLERRQKGLWIRERAKQTSDVLTDHPAAIQDAGVAKKR